ncbi:MAG: response regulator [bacterium]|nr:response regulator [bacterium]
MTDRVLQICSVVYALALVVVVLGRIQPGGMAEPLLPLVDSVLVGTTIFALLWGRRRVDGAERRFWDMLALAWFCWLLVEGVFFFDLSIPLVTASFTADALYILFYLVFALAVDLRPHIEKAPSPRRSRRRLESVAGVTVVFGVLIYFAIVVLPEPLGVSLSFVSRDRGLTPLLFVRLSLDLLLLGRLVHAMVGCRGRWVRLYGLLSIGMLCFALKDAIAALQSAGLFSQSRPGILYGIFVSLPGFFVILAARFRHAPDAAISSEGVKFESDETSGGFRTSPLVLYAVIVPSLHFLLYPLGLLEPASRAPREVYSLVYIVVLGGMGLVHQWMLVNDSRRAGQALRKAKERLFRSQRLESVGRLAGGIAHDFNNYLTVIRGYTELVRERLDDPRARSAMGYVEEAARKATHLTRQLLAFGRRQVLHPEPMNLNEVVVDTSKLLDSLLGEDVRLEVDLDPNVGLARADVGQIEQVVMNLALNGRDAMPGGGTLSIQTRRVRLSPDDATELEIEPGRYVTLEIGDTGFGMTEEVQAQALEPFFTTKELGQGTGLGLSTVHGIVAQSGGAMSLESGVGTGTTVRVLLPSAVPRPAAESIPSARPTPRSADATMLVVEDERQVRSLVTQALSERGFRVHEATGGPEALAGLSDYGPIDLLITDVMMAEMDGVELAERMTSRCPGLRVLFISGYPAETLRERQAALPSSIQLLEKPFTPAALVAKVHEVLAEIQPTVGCTADRVETDRPR